MRSVLPCGRITEEPESAARVDAEEGQLARTGRLILNARARTELVVGRALDLLVFGVSMPVTAECRAAREGSRRPRRARRTPCFEGGAANDRHERYSARTIDTALAIRPELASVMASPLRFFEQLVVSSLTFRPGCRVRLESAIRAGISRSRSRRHGLVL